MLVIMMGGIYDAAVEMDPEGIRSFVILEQAFK
jgi:hypothetical protein